VVFGIERQTQITLPDGKTILYEYNGFGDLVSTTAADGQVTVFSYDAAGRQIGSYEQSPTGDRFEALLDNTDATFAGTGTWETETGSPEEPVGYGDDYRYLDYDPATMTGVSASWSVTTPAYVDGASAVCGAEVSYQILATWPADAAHAPSIDINVYDDSTNLLETFTLDQREFEVQAIFDDYTWQSLGLISLPVDQATGAVSDLTIEIVPNASTTGRIVCDGLAVIEAVPSTQNVIGPGGETLLTIDGLGWATRTEYNANLQPTKVTDPEGGEVAYTYTTTGQLESVTDPTGNTTSYTYDQYGRMIEERVTSDGVDYTTSYEYAIDGSLVKKTDRDGQVTAYYNDNFGRQVLERTYDSLADFTAVATPNRERVSTYNVFSWAITITEGEVHRRYGYDGLGRRSSVADSVSGMPEVVYTSAHSAAGQLTGLSATIDGVADFADAFTYNARGLLDSITRKRILTRSVDWRFSFPRICKEPDDDESGAVGEEGAVLAVDGRGAAAGRADCSGVLSRAGNLGAVVLFVAKEAAA